ncbi:MAG: hypothetical protein ABIK98_13490 [Pseudomonadota bacterium]
MNLKHYKTQKTIAAVLLFTTVLIINFTPILAQEQADPGAMVKVEKIKDNEWNIINKDGEFVGTLKSESLRTFTFYNTTGMLVGTILESGAWQPRLYRSRDTLIQPDEAQLYLDALEATQLLKK